MPTAETYIQQALQELGVLEPGEALPPEHLETGLFRLQAMLDEWSEEGLLVPMRLSAAFTVGAMQAATSYTLGVAAATPDITAEITVLHSVVYQRANERDSFPLGRVSQTELIRRTDAYAAGGPTFYFFDNAVPLATLMLNASTRQNDRLWVHYDGYLTAESIAGNTDLTLPRGYTRPILLNLAKELGPNFGATLSRESTMAAKRGKSNLRSRNHQPTGAGLDPSLPGMRGNTNKLYPYSR